jgi:hypothetical protein
LLNWYTKKKGLILKNLIVSAKTKKKKKINILEFGRELRKENWSLGICVAFFFSGSIIA